MTSTPVATSEAQTPSGLNHLVINVRDIEASHHFWTQLIGLKLVGTIHGGPAGSPAFRFYSGLRNGQLRHHDLALAESRTESGNDTFQSLNHIAIEYPSAESWHKQIEFLLSRGIELFRRVERGATHSIHLRDPNGIVVELVHELPRIQWEHDIEGALNTAVVRPVTD